MLEFRASCFVRQRLFPSVRKEYGTLVAEFIRPPKLYTFRFIAGNIIRKV